MLRRNRGWIADSYDLLADDIEMREKRTRQTPTGTG
jgi:hypothetical protein